MTPSDGAPVQGASGQDPAGGQGTASGQDPAGGQSTTDGDRLDPKALAAVGATVVFWASAFPGIKVALEAYTPGEVALFRFLVASLVLGVYAIAVRMQGPRLSDIPAIAGLGLLGITLYHLGVNYGEVTVSAGAASLLIAAAPVFAALLATAVLRERLTVFGWVGIGVSFVGVALVTFGEGEGLNADLRAFFILFSAVSASGYIVLQKPLLRVYGALRLTTFCLWAGTVPLLVFLPGMLGNLAAAPAGPTVAVVYMGVFPGALAYLFWSYALSRAPASLVASFLYVPPALTILIAWVWLREVPTVLTVVGGGVAVLGVFIVNTRGRRLPQAS